MLHAYRTGFRCFHLCRLQSFRSHAEQPNPTAPLCKPRAHRMRYPFLGSIFQHFEKETQTMDRTANAVWNGSLKEGKGTLSTQSGVLKNAQYSFAARFESGIGTNPEELIAAAHAGCFSMAFSAELGKAGFTPDSI